MPQQASLYGFAAPAVVPQIEDQHLCAAQRLHGLVDGVRASGVAADFRQFEQGDGVLTSDGSDAVIR